MSKPIASFQD